MDLDHAIDHVYAPFIRPREIRIAIIEPSMDYDAPLRFSFQQAPLEDLEGEYEAVSYVWGAPILTFPVYHTTDGSQICVTENLDKALRRRRHRSDCRWLWADAMCINQRNDREKEIQIPLMVDIFRGAKRVLAWIHEGDEAIERGMRHIGCLSRQSITSRYFEEGGSDHNEIKDVTSFVTLPYFRRLWIVQEIVFSLDITLICGKSKLSWIRLAKGLVVFQSRLQSENYWLGDEFNGLKTVADLWKRNAIMQKLDSSLPSRPHHEHILDLVIKLSKYGCTDARDRIFAVHALSHRNHAGVAIDYTLDVYATYRRFALACMADGRTLAVLDAAGARLDMKSHTSWPSWLPDWRRMPALIKDHDGSSMIEYIRELDEDTIELEVDHILPPYARLNGRYVTRPLIVCTEGVVRMGKSVFAFFHATCKLYREAFGGRLTDFEAMWRFLDISFRTIGIKDPQLSELKSHMDLLWRMPGKYTQNMRKDEIPLEDSIVELMEGYCFFTAEHKDVDFCTPFCFGRVNIKEGDIVMAAEKIGESHSFGSQAETYYRTLILRSTKPPSDDKRRAVPEGTCWTETPYRIISEAWLLFPRRPSHGGVRVHVC